jgi:hypothetical protein
MAEVAFELIGFSELEKPLAYIATSMTANLCFPNGNYPPLRSNVIRIVRKPSAPVPMYVADVPVELIIVNCTENRPWQYTYQVAHEFGHLATRADPRLDGNKWIEEAIWGADRSPARDLARYREPHPAAARAQQAQRARARRAGAAL